MTPVTFFIHPAIGPIIVIACVIGLILAAFLALDDRRRRRFHRDSLRQSIENNRLEASTDPAKHFLG